MNSRGVTYFVAVHDDADPATAAKAFWRACSSAAKISATMVVVNRTPPPAPDRPDNAPSTRRKRKLSSSGADR